MSAGTSPPKNILIIRLSAIGDVVVASGLIPALHSAYPGVRLVWLVEDLSAPLLIHNPRLDRVLVWPRRRFRQLWQARRYRECWRELRTLVRELRRENFDLVLDLQGLLKSGIWARLSGGHRRIGIGSREGSQWFMHQVIPRKISSPLIGKQYRELARTLGIAPHLFSMDVVTSAAEVATAQTKLHSAQITVPFVILAPFTTRPQKHWFDERWVNLAHRLTQERGVAVAILGGPADQPHAAGITAQAPHIHNWVGQTTLGEGAALIQKAALVIGVDTGLTHLAIAMRTPTLALFGSTCPYLDGQSDRVQVLYEPMTCSPCRRRPTCHGDFTCMRAHTVDQVFSAARQLLESAA